MHVKADLLDDVGDVGAVNVRYWRALVRLLKWVGSAIGGLDSAEIVAYVSTGVKTGLQSTMPAHSRTSRANWRWVRKSPSAWCCMETPKKMMEGPEILHGEFPLEGRYGLL
jgi:hypothetical protein